MFFRRLLLLFSGFFFSILFFIPRIASAQCVSQFPYNEGFENNAGGWTTGGNASDWTWGAPAKSVIQRAGDGNKCWITGTLTGNFYNENENSWLQSQCFDFTSLQLPYISFLVNWDTEKDYDGAALQYSNDNGVSWQSAGSYNDAPTGCADNYWFNNANIRYGVQLAGWSGYKGNGGGAGWVKAYHSFPELAGKKNVTFRFVFGAGKIQNNYNGFAVDDIYIGETPGNDTISFTYTCTATPKSASFIPVSSDCVSALQWNFGDPASGSANILPGDAGLHEFSSAGIYTVTLSGNGKNNETVSSTQTIIIPDVVATITAPVTCSGAAGTVQATVINTNAKAYFTWNTEPAITTPGATLQAGYYQVTASVDGGCANNTSVLLTEPSPLQHVVQSIAADCNNQNGQISITESGGVEPYSYNWSSNISSSASAGNLSSGNYSITITDKNACTDKADVVVASTPSPVFHSISTLLPDCGETNGSIEIITNGGAPGYTYQWMPAISSTSRADNIPAGKYIIIASDMNRCNDTATVTLTSKPVTVSLGNDTVVCKGQTISLQANGSYASYLWNDGTTMPIKQVSREGNYILQVTSAGGCTASDTIHISVGCGDLMFPSGFTPNGDGVNETFGPSGGLSFVSSYRLLVYNRYGGIVFQSTNAYQKWTGDTKGIKIPGTYTYVAVYTYEGEKKVKKGTITLLL